MHQAAALDFRKFPQRRTHVAAENGDGGQLFHVQQFRAQSVVDVVIVVGDLVGQIGNLGLEAGPLALDEPFADITQGARVFQRTVLEYALAGFERQIETVKSAVALFQHIDDAQ